MADFRYARDTTTKIMKWYWRMDSYSWIVSGWAADFWFAKISGWIVVAFSIHAWRSWSLLDGVGETGRFKIADC
jgi:hypothetical protein